MQIKETITKNTVSWGNCADCKNRAILYPGRIKRGGTPKGRGGLWLLCGLCYRCKQQEIL